MQIVRLLIAGIAVIFGLVLALCIAVMGVLIFAISRLFGRSSAPASFKVNFHRPTPPRAAPPVNRIARDGAIDIEVTEVKN